MDAAEPGVRGGLYGALGVGQDASAADLKKAYRDCAKIWHPDKTAHLSDDEKAAADAKFNAAREAFDILSDPQRREIYDATGESSGGGTRHETAAYLAEVFGDLSALSPLCGTLWLELLFCDEMKTAPDKLDSANTDIDGTRAGYPTSDDKSASDSTAASINSERADGGAAKSGMGVRLARHLYASASYSMMPSGGGSGDAKSGSAALLKRQREREVELTEGLRERLSVKEGGDFSEEHDAVVKTRTVEAASEIAGTTHPRGLRLLRASAQGLLATSSWSLMGPRTAHIAKAQWALAKAAGSALWAVVGGSEEAAAEHASEAVTRLSEADVLCTCFAARAALLEGVGPEVQAATTRRLTLLAEALMSAADASEARANEIAAAQYKQYSKPSQPAKHRLKMPGGMLYLGAAAHRDGESGGDLVPHRDGRLFFADGSCHDGHFDYGRADGRGRLFGSAAAQAGCVWEGIWKQNRRVGSFEVWDAKGVQWLERYDDTGKKVARKKAPVAGTEVADSAVVQEVKELHPAVTCKRCDRLFQLRWGSVQWCRSHGDGLWDADKSKWSCCGAAEKDSPGCEVDKHQAA